MNSKKLQLEKTTPLFPSPSQANKLKMLAFMFKDKKIKYVTNHKEFYEAVKLDNVDVICFIEEKAEEPKKKIQRKDEVWCPLCGVYHRAVELAYPIVAWDSNHEDDDE